MLASSELQEPNTLPSARCQLSICDGDAHGSTDQGGFDVCGHVVQSFGRVAVEVSFAVFRGDAVEGVGHVVAGKHLE